MSIRDQLARLVDLQAAELELRRLEATLAEYPAQRAALEAEIAAAGKLIVDAESQREGSLKTRRTLESELQDAEAKIDKYREQEMQVKTNEQLWAIQEEMRGVQAEISRTETGILEEMERADSGAAAIEAAKQALSQTETRVEAAVAEVDARESDLRSQVERAEAQIEQLRAGVGDLLVIYERVKGVRGGIGLAEIGSDGNCLACRVRLRPQLALEAVQMEEPCQCENCKRLLFSAAALDVPSSMQLTTD